MKTNLRTAHDYMTVSVKSDDKASINLTTSWRGAKLTSSSFPNTVGAAQVTAAFKEHKVTIQLFLKGPKKTSFKAWMDQTQACAEAASTFDDFFKSLAVELPKILPPKECAHEKAHPYTVARQRNALHG